MNFLDIFVEPPGDLIYFVLVVVLSLAGLWMMLAQWFNRPQDARMRGYTQAMLGVSAAWLLLLLGTLVAVLLRTDGVRLLPPLERAAQVLTVVMASWALLAADHGRWGAWPRRFVGLLVLLTLLGYGVTALSWWQTAPSVSFTQTAMHAVWTLALLGIALLAGLLSLFFFRLVVDAPLKLVFYTVLIVGSGVTMVQLVNGTAVGSYAGVLRLTFVAAMSLLTLLIYRVVTMALEADVQAIAMAVTAHPSTQPLAALPTMEDEDAMRRKKTDPQKNTPSDSPPAVPAPEDAAVPSIAPRFERESVQLLRALGLILENATPTSIPTQVVRAILDVLRADVGALLRLHDANYADITAVYDSAMKRSLSGIPVNLDNQPTLVNAIERRAQRGLFEDRNQGELEDFYARLEISQLGPVYFQPLIHDGEIVAVLMIALPYTQRELSSAEKEFLKGVGVISAGLLSISYMAIEASIQAEERAIQAVIQGIGPLTSEAAVDESRVMDPAALDAARTQIDTLSQQVTALKLELEEERQRVAATLAADDESLSVSQRIVAINSAQDQLREERDTLAARLQEAEAALTGARTQDDQALLHEQMARVQQERDQLEAEKVRLAQQIAEMRAAADGDGMIVPGELGNVVERMSDEQARLEAERDSLKRRLVGIATELKKHGIDARSGGLSRLITQLYEERVRLRTQAKKLSKERDALLAERTRLEERIQAEGEREAALRTLQDSLRHLAADHEAAVRQRDALRRQRDEAEARTESVKQHRARLMAEVSALEMTLEENYEEQRQLRLEVQNLSDERSDLLHQLSVVLAEKESLAADCDALRMQLGITGARSGQEGLRALQNMVQELSGQRNHLQVEVNRLKTTLADAEKRLARVSAQARALMPPDGVQPHYDAHNAETILGVVEELRTPMTAIIGYLDLLLGESVGILGEMQRRFLQRVASNVARLTGMLNDLVRLTEVDTGRFTLKPGPLDVVALLEDAITNASLQFREKGLTVNLSIEQDAPHPEADRDAVGQVIEELLTNAYLVTPPDGAINVTVGRRDVLLSDEGAPIECLHLAVEDRGGGLLPEDEARVFARKYRAEHPLIAGLGDTSVGLAVAKVLVEAHLGRLWMESTPDVGTTFNLVLPIKSLVPQALAEE